MRPFLRWWVVALAVSGCQCTRQDVSSVAGEVRAEPVLLDVGETYVGRPVEQRVTLTNTGRAARTVSLSTAAPFTVPAQVEVAGGEATTVPVGFTPVTPGEVDGTLSLVGATPATITLRGRALEVPVCAAAPPCQVARFDVDARACLTERLPDGSPCTSPCLSSGACVMGECRGAVSTACDDANACTIDACGATGECVHAPLECPVSDPCTAAYCDPALGCQTRAVDDGTPCGEETCRQALICLNGQCVARQRPGAADECTPVDLAASTGATCVLTRAGTVRCWGSAHATPGNVFARPAVLPRAARATTLSMGLATCNALEPGGFQCGLLAPRSDAGAVLAVVNNNSGACWVLTDAGVACQVQSWVPPPPAALTSLSANTSSFCGVTVDGGVACWGYVPDLVPRGDAGFVGQAVFALGAPARAVRRGDQGTCVLQDDGVDCWAASVRPDGSGAPGPRSTVRLSREVTDVALAFWRGEALPVLRDGGVLRCVFEGDGGLSCAGHDAGLPPARKVAVGSDHACVLTLSDEVACFGSNQSAELSDLSPAPPSPTLVPGVTVALAGFGVGSRSVAAVLLDGGVVTWGEGSAQPAPLPLSAVGATAIVSVPRATCVLLADGAVECWDGARHRITGVPPLVRFAPCAFSVAAGQAFVVALTDAGVPCGFSTDGATASCNPLAEAAEACGTPDARCSVVADGGVVCNGTNRYGQLGTGDTLERFQPVAVPLPARAVKVAMSQLQACALLVGGQVQCWGLDLSTSRPMTPTPLPRVLPFARDLVCGATHCCVLVGANGVSCWGENTLNQLGREGPQSPAPVPVALPARVTQLLASDRTTCAVLAGGALWCWGDNHAGQRGLSPVLSSSAPVFVR